jgi:hypothetical protein
MSKFIGNSLPEFPTFPHTGDEIYGKTAESQAKIRIFYIKRRNALKVFPMGRYRTSACISRILTSAE